jgi:hypothetical protein
MKMFGLVFLILGVVFLLADLGKWNFWGIQWWTALFLIIGLGYFCKSSCPECIKMCKKK